MTRTLSPDRWEQIRTAFDEIVELDAARRDQRLKTIGAKDPELRSSLEALLQADARANAWLAPVESPLGFVPAAEDISTSPNAEEGLLARVSLTRRRWLMIAAGVVALGGGGFAAVSAITRPAPNTETDWGAAASQPGIAASNYSLVGVNLRGEERPLADVSSQNAGSWGSSVLDTAYVAWPKVSPDGKRVAVEVRTADQQWDIWVYDLAGRSQRRLTDDFTGVRPLLNVALGPLDASAVILPLGDNDLWIASFREQGAARPLVRTSSSEVDPRLSRDGQLLAYASNESGQFEVYVLAISDPSRRVQVSSGGGTQPVWSPDGRQLFYRSPDRMMRATVWRGERLTVERVEPLFADVYERHDVTNYDVLPSGEELVMIRARSR